MFSNTQHYKQIITHDTHCSECGAAAALLISGVTTGGKKILKRFFFFEKNKVTNK